MIYNETLFDTPVPQTLIFAVQVKCMGCTETNDLNGRSLLEIPYAGSMSSLMQIHVAGCKFYIKDHKKCPSYVHLLQASALRIEPNTYKLCHFMIGKDSCQRIIF